MRFIRRIVRALRRQRAWRDIHRLIRRAQEDRRLEEGEEIDEIVKLLRAAAEREKRGR
jgi:hypothetical protein